MSTFRTAKTGTVSKWGEGISLATVRFNDGSSGEALVLEELIGFVELGDTVIVNTTAVDLGLGSGGYHFVLWNCSRDSVSTGEEGHIMKLRYTPLQLNVKTIEEELEDTSCEPGEVLGGMPVLAGSLHSQLLPCALSYKSENPSGQLVYIMTDGGALPLKFSRTVRFLREEGYLSSTISCGHCFGGEHEAVTIFGALAASRKILGADAVVVMMGPGIVGTGSVLGFSGMEEAIAINAAASLGGRPVAIPRIMFNDPRERHLGLSHHSISVLKFGARAKAVVPIPFMREERRERVWSQIKDSGIDLMHEIVEIKAEKVIPLIENCGFSPSVMGRSVKEEPEFFEAAGAAGMIAARW
ncbi:MAG: DUF3866 family protein [Actinomycetota bacterium]|nr:DUF3866 family protein [Actinomycetota bacterium]